MILKNIILTISGEKLAKFHKEKDREKWKRELAYSSSFNNKAHCLVSFLDRTVLKPLRFKTDSFSAIQIVLEYSKPQATVNLGYDKLAYTEINFPKIEYDSLKTKKEYNEYFIKIATEGLIKVKKHINIPLNELLHGMEEFREGDYENRWTFKTRQFKEFGIKCRLNCNVTLENFHLRLQIEKKDKQLIFDQEILRTDPNEFAYHYKFKDIIIEDGYIVVTKKLHSDNILFRISMDELKL